MSDRACINCRNYYERPSGSGECRRYRPTIPHLTHAHIGVFPGVLRDSWCGEFESSEPEEGDAEEYASNIKPGEYLK